MKLALWNIDHPEKNSGSKRNQQRFNDVRDYLISADCDVYILTEANEAIDLNGYSREFSQESPYKSTSRFYGSPNRYFQVAMYSREPINKIDVQEPINSLQIYLGSDKETLCLYGDVVTIKDRWRKESDMKYRDRLDQQIEAIQNLPEKRVLIAGDFNLRIGWTQKKKAYARLQEVVRNMGLLWSTEMRRDTVQHVIHSPDLSVDLQFDFSNTYDEKGSEGLSDHPFVMMDVSFTQ